MLSAKSRSKAAVISDSLAFVVSKSVLITLSLVSVNSLLQIESTDLEYQKCCVDHRSDGAWITELTLDMAHGRLKDSCLFSGFPRVFLINSKQI